MKLEVTESNAYRRLDRFLRRSLQDVPLSAVYKFIRKGKVFVNGKRVRNVAHELHIGDVVEIKYVDLESYRRRKKELLPQKIDLEILYEDDSILVLNKPPGMALHPGKGVHITTLIEGLIHYGMEKGFDPHLVHRLDLNTSGVLVVAKNKKNARILTEYFKNRLVEKRYKTLVKGHVEKPGNVRTDLDGQHALTIYKPLKIYREVTFLDVQIKTGRKHQIRRHMSVIGHPVVGDDKYGNRSFNRYFRRKYGLKRQFLHCSKVVLPHPEKSTRMSFEAPLWEDLSEVLKRLDV